MAEREGFEPPELSLNGFQDRRLKPLGHLSGLIVDVDDRFAIRIESALQFESYRLLGVILSAPPMYGLSASGITTLPSGC